MMEAKALGKKMGGGLMSDGNGNVKWPAFLATILVLFGLMFSNMALSLSKAEFSQFEKRFDENMVRIFDEFKGLKK